MTQLLLKNQLKLEQRSKLQLGSTLHIKTALPKASVDKNKLSSQHIKPCEVNCHVVKSAYEMINRSIQSKKIGVPNKYIPAAVEDMLVLASSKLMLLQQLQKQHHQQHQPQMKVVKVVKKRNCRRCPGFASILREDCSKKPVSYAIPAKVIKQYEKLTCFLELHILRKLLRPQIYFDLEWHSKRGNKSLGRIVFQLFTEACPAIVLEFVRCCAAKDNKRMRVEHVTKNIWLECVMHMSGHKTLDFDAMEHDKNVLSHDMCAGILSFPLAYLQCSQAYDELNFTVSLSPLQLQEQSRVGFGVLHKGHWVMKNVQKLTSKMSRSAHRLVFAKCGVLNRI